MTLIYCPPTPWPETEAESRLLPSGSTGAGASHGPADDSAAVLTSGQMSLPAGFAI